MVIGATGALGGAIAEGLGEAGAKVAVVGRNEERGQARVKAIQDKGGKAAFFAADAIKKESLHAAHLAIEEALGAPTILVNAAGGNDPKVTVTPDNPFEKIPLEDWQANFDLNLVGGVFLPCQEFGPGMVARGKGSIINIASVSAPHPAVAGGDLFRGQGRGAEPDPVPGARMGAQRRAGEHASRPGFFPAEQNRKLLFNDDGSPTDRTKSILGHTPMNRFGEAHELVGAAIFLASSPASSFVTGADIRVDGGFLSQTI